MCGRFELNEKSETIAEFYVADVGFADWRPTFSMAPGQVVPVVRDLAHEDGSVSRLFEPATWNYWPRFLDREPRRPNFNARLETVATRGLWKGGFARGRCVVPMSGYFEWEERPDGKQPYLLHGDGMLSAAAISTARQDESGEWHRSVAVITREARDASGAVHSRMPVLLDRSVLDTWLNPTKIEDDEQRDEMLALIDEVSEAVAATLVSSPVSRRINNARTLDQHDPTLIEPVEA